MNQSECFPNAEQRAVIECSHGAILVLAPAGTGKTRVMGARLAHAINKGFHPRRTLCVTFTNRAAGEIRDRVRGELGTLADEVSVFTFHGLCAWILRCDASAIGLPRDFVVYDEQDCEELLVKLARGASNGRELFYRISQLKANLPPSELGLSGIPKLFRGQDEEWLRDIVTEYHRTLVDRNALDFSDLIHRARSAFHCLPQVREKWAQRFDWIQVDEIQDTHYSEYDVLTFLAKRQKNLACFGDLDQTIYEWRGSDPDNILRRFRTDFQPVREFNLSLNHRATQTLLKAADTFAASFQNRRTRIRPRPDLPQGEPVVRQTSKTPTDEAEWVASRLKSILGSTAPASLHQVGVLTRTHRRAEIISSVLTRAGVPHVTVEEFEFFRRQEIKDALARLRLLLNPFDSGALHRVLLRPASGIGDVTLEHLQREGLPAGLRLTDLVRLRTHLQREPFAPLLAALRRSGVVVVDVETTGLSAVQDEVIEVAALRIEAGKLTNPFHRYVRASKPVGDSERTHGISDSFLRKHGHAPAEVFAELSRLLEGAHLVGHNIRFDLAMLEHHAKRVGVDLRFPDWDDTLDIARRLLEAVRYDLATLADQLNLPSKPKHKAGDDVVTTANLLLRLVPQLAATSQARASLVERYGKPFGVIAQFFEKWHELAKSMRPPNLLDRIMTESGLRQFYSNEPKRNRHLDELLKIFQSRDQVNTSAHSALEQLTQAVALARNVDHLDENDRRVPVLTVHQTKGLEFDAVFVVGVSEGEFPAYLACRDGREEEERRLFYVAITRARRRLFLSSYQLNDRNKPAGPSRFLRHLPY
jgi:DNA helicase-2/ATP-dependent DNA helicase PcrA